MEKLNLETKNLAQDKYKKLAELFPNAITETILGQDEEGNDIIERAIDADVLRQEISQHVIEGREERYEFNWPDKRKSMLLANAPINKTLRPIREDSLNFDETENLYIEGDNLDVLKLLRETYLGKVKMIYIDPPYNTGNDFVYEDNFAKKMEDYKEVSGGYDEEGNRLFKNIDSNGRFHTDWLNMMYPRLKLARDLLSDDGAILINMDENEIINIQKICQEIFGEFNDLGTIIWDKRNPKGDAKGISHQHEYIVIFANNKNILLKDTALVRPKKSANSILKKADSLYNNISESYSLKDANIDFVKWINKQKEFSGGEKAYNKIDEDGNVYRPVSMAWPNKKKAPDVYFIPLVHPVTGKECPVPARGWRNPPNTMKKLLEKGLIIFGEDETTQPNRKYLLSENIYENIPSLLYYGGSDTYLLEELQIPFETPKVVDVCKEHIKAFTSESDIILDFFSGSATTAHAVMELNAEDGGSRKYIMVQLAEETGEKSEAYKAGYKNICEIGKERIRRAGKKIKEENPDSEFDDGFRVLRVDSSNMKDVYHKPETYSQSFLDKLKSNIKEDRNEEDLLFQVMLSLGVDLSSKIQKEEINDNKVLIVEDGFLISCFDEEISEETIEFIAKKQPYYAVFSEGKMSDSTLANFEQIFDTYSPTTIRKVI